MIHYHLAAALAVQRREELGADMRAARWPGPDRPWPGTTAARRRVLRRVAGWLGGNGWRSRPRDPANGRQTVLRDGSEVLIRPIRGIDAPLLAAADNAAVERLARNIGADLVEREHATVTYEISLQRSSG